MSNIDDNIYRYGGNEAIMVRNEVWGTQQAADELNRLTRDLAAALATVEKCKAAGFIDERGEVRKVHGCPVILKDGAFCLGNKPVYHPDLMFGELPMPLTAWQAGNGVWYGRDFTGDYQERSRLMNKCYSTPEAALGAKA